MGEIVEIMYLTIHKTQYDVWSMVNGGFYDENDEISKNATAFTANEPNIWGK